MVLESIFTKNNKINSVFFKKFKSTDEWKNIKKDGMSDVQSVYHFVNNINEIPKCRCGKELIFKQFTTGYSTSCSRKCSGLNENRTQKIKQTKLKKYGSEGFNNTDKRKKTNQKKYGVEYGFQAKEIKDKILNTLSLRYGVHNVSQIDAVKLKKKGRCGNPEKAKERHRLYKLNHPSYLKMMNKEWFINEYQNKGIVDIAKDLGVAFSTVNNYRREHGIDLNWQYRSKIEQEIANFIKSFHIEVIQSTRNIIPPKEIDIYIPSHKLAIEIDGLYWHSIINYLDDTVKNQNYHLNKTLDCEQQGIQLLHFTDQEWNQKQDIVKSIIKSKLNLNTRIYGRKCQIINISASQGSSFIKDNHIQGSCIGGEYKGLVFDGDLVAVMQIGKSRFNKKYDYELLRFCSKTGTNIVGGFSKLLKSFNLAGIIISYANRRWSTGSVYLKNGFELLHTSNPNYYYWKEDSFFLQSRQKFQKHKIKTLLDSFDENLTESENMFNNGYYKFYDSGNLIFIQNFPFQPSRLPASLSF